MTAPAPSPHRVASEVGRLRTVLLHRPGAELLAAHAAQQRRPALRRAAVGGARAGGARRLRPGAARPRRRGALPDRAARRRRSTPPRRARRSCARPSRPTVVGPTLATVLTSWLLDLPSEELAGVLAAGLTHDELPSHGPDGVVARLAGPGDFVVRPLPNLLFTRDSSVWVDDHVAITSPSMHARQRERDPDRRDLPPPPALRGHPAALRRQQEEAWFEGGDVLVMARASSPSARASARRRPGSRPSRCGPSRPASRTPCSPSRSRRSGRRCTSTPSARWSTATRS